MLKIASWNVNSLNVRLPHVLAWCDVASPDILALQETKLTDDRFPADELLAAGYQSVFSGQKTYNGVAILSRDPATDIVTDIDGLDDPQRRILGATIGGVRIINLYVVNGSEVGSEKYAYKLHWLEQVIGWITAEMQKYEKLIVLGDFNIAEPGALIGFAGPRVIRETIGTDLPKGFQSSEFVLDHGFLDFIVDRRQLKAKLTTLLQMLQN